MVGLENAWRGPTESQNYMNTRTNQFVRAAGQMWDEMGVRTYVESP